MARKTWSFKFSLCIIVYVGQGSRVPQHGWRSEGSFLGLILSTVESGTWTHIFRLVQRLLPAKPSPGLFTVCSETRVLSQKLSAKMTFVLLEVACCVFPSGGSGITLLFLKDWMLTLAHKWMLCSVGKPWELKLGLCPLLRSTSLNQVFSLLFLDCWIAIFFKCRGHFQPHCSRIQRLSWVVLNASGVPFFPLHGKRHTKADLRLGWLPHRDRRKLDSLPITCSFPYDLKWLPEFHPSFLRYRKKRKSED